MLVKLLLPVMSASLLIFAVVHVLNRPDEQRLESPPTEPSRSPFPETVAGAGTVEAQTKNIEVGTSVPGVVTKVFVQVGQSVDVGTPLFQLDDRALRADLKAREADLASARSALARLKNQPRAEDVPIAEAIVRETEAQNVQSHDQLNRMRQLSGRGVATEEQVVRAQQEAQSLAAKLDRAQAELKLLRAGAWEPDLAVAEAAVLLAQTRVDQATTEMERLNVRALTEGEILQVNVSAGEYVSAPPQKAAVLMGNVRTLHVRVDIDEHDIARFQQGAAARGFVRGNLNSSFPLRFVQVEPYVVPKRSLTGNKTERIDTRVLQVIYEIDGALAFPLFVGQQVDVYVDASSVPSNDPSRRDLPVAR